MATTRPVLDMHKSVDDNSKVLAKAALAWLERHPKSTLEEVISNMIFGILEVEEVGDELEAKILLSMGRSFGCQIINTPEDEIAMSVAEDKELDEVLGDIDLDDTPSNGVVHDIDLTIHDDHEED